MNSDPTFCRFGDLFEVPQRNGLTRPKRVRGVGLPMVNMGELFAYKRIHDIPMDLVPFKDSEGASLLKHADLLFARQSLVLEGAGQCSIFLGHKKTVFESHLIRCRIDPCKGDPLFYYYFFSSQPGKDLIRQIVSQGAGASGIKGSELVELLVPKPPKTLQKKISHLMNAIDNEIETLTRQSAALESIAQTLFRSWFVDFDPVHAKAAGNAPEAMSTELAELFPSEFENSELGLIPKGWAASTVGAAFEVNPRRSLSKGSTATFLDMANVSTRGHRPSQRLELREFVSGTKFTNGDTLLARITPCLENGKTTFVDFLLNDEVAGGSTEFVVLRTKGEMPKYWSYLLARRDSFRNFAIQAMTGTSGRQRVDVSTLKRYPFVVPPPNLLRAVSPLFESIQKQIACNSDTSLSLAALRDHLLPRLVSGKLRLKDAEASVAGITSGLEVEPA